MKDGENVDNFLPYIWLKILKNLHQNEGNGKNMVWFGIVSVFVPCEPVFFSLWFWQASRQDVSTASPRNVLDGDHRLALPPPVTMIMVDYMRIYFQNG